MKNVLFDENFNPIFKEVPDSKRDWPISEKLDYVIGGLERYGLKVETICKSILTARIRVTQGFMSVVKEFGSYTDPDSLRDEILTLFNIHPNTNKEEKEKEKKMTTIKHIEVLLNRRGFTIVARHDNSDGSVSLIIGENGSLMTIEGRVWPHTVAEWFVDYVISAYRKEQKHNNTPKSLTITKVIFNDPATIVFWADGTKTVVKCCEHDEFDPEKGMAMAIAKKALGGDLKPIRKWTEKYREEERNRQERLDALRAVLNDILGDRGGK